MQLLSFLIKSLHQLHFLAILPESINTDVGRKDQAEVFCRGSSQNILKGSFSLKVDVLQGSKQLSPFCSFEDQLEQNNHEIFTSLSKQVLIPANNLPDCNVRAMLLGRELFLKWGGGRSTQSWFKTDTFIADGNQSLLTNWYHVA